MEKGHRDLMRFVVQDIKTGAEEEVFLDCYAIWKDLGHGMLQPVRSTQGVSGLSRLKAGQAIVSMGTRYKRLDDNVYPKNTSMNKRDYSRLKRR